LERYRIQCRLCRRAEELIACWTLVVADWRLLGSKTGATRLGFALVHKLGVE
jgi:hypothetical protein